MGQSDIDYIYADVSTGRALKNVSGEISEFTLIAGQQVSYGVSFLRRLDSGELGKTSFPVIGLRAALFGAKLPLSGIFRIQVASGVSTGSNTTRDIDVSASAFEVEDALNSIPIRPCNFQCDEDGGSFVVRRLDGFAIDGFQVYCDQISPLCSADIYVENSLNRGYVYKTTIRQLPLVFSDGTKTILPDQPFVTSVQKGGSRNTGGVSEKVIWWNEIQAFQIPEKFQGSYQFRRNATYARSAPLDAMAGIKEIEEALNAMLKDERALVRVTNPLNNVAHIEFDTATPSRLLSGLQGQDVELLTVEVLSAPSAIPLIEFDLTSNVVREALNGRDSIDAIFEAEAVVWKNVNDQSLGTRKFKLWSTPAKIKGSRIWENLSNQLATNWQERIVPSTYVPYTSDQYLVGQQEAVIATFGVKQPNGLPRSAATDEIEIDHNIPTVANVVLMETRWGGMMIPQSYYEVYYKTPKTVRIKLKKEAYQSFHLCDGIQTAFTPSYLLQGLEANDPPLGFVGIEKVVRKGVNSGQPNWVPAIVPPSAYWGDSWGNIHFYVAPLRGETVAIGSVPPAGWVKAVITGYGPASTFLAHHHTIGQITQLQTVLDAFGARILALEKLIPKTGGVAGPPQAIEQKISLPNYGEILPDLGALDDEISVSSQLAKTMDSNAQQSPIMPGSDLSKEKALAEAAKAKADAEIEALKAAAAKAAAAAAEAIKAKAADVPVAKTNGEISMIKIDQFGSLTTTTTNVTTSKVTDGVTETTSTPVSIKTIEPVVYPLMRGGKYPWLLPAIHSSAPIPISMVPDLSASKGRVYINSSAASLALPGGGGRKGQIVPSNGWFGGDGRAVYALQRAGTSSTYHPVEMERDLIRVFIRPEQFPINSSLKLKWQLNLTLKTDQLQVGANYLMPIEITPILNPSTPVGVGANLGGLGTPVLIGRPAVCFSRGSREERSFALELTRKSVGGLLVSESSITDYGKTITGPVNFATDIFLLTIRLCDWDVDDSSLSNTGQIGVMMPETRIIVEEI